MIKFYAFYEALERLISRRKARTSNDVGLNIKIPSKIALRAALSCLVSFCATLSQAQSYSAATHNYQDRTALTCAASKGVYNVVYDNTIAFIDPTRIQYISKQGKIKATATIQRNEYTEVRSMIATSDDCALIAGYAMGCDYIPTSSHYFLAKMDSTGNVLFSLNLLSSGNANGATGLAEDAADSSYYVYLPNKLVHVSKTGVVLYSGGCAGNYMLGKRFSNGDVIAVNSNTMLTYGDSVGFTNFYQQPLAGYAKQVCVSRNNLIYVLTYAGIEKFDAQLQPMGTYAVGTSINAIDLKNDTLYLTGVNNGLAFIQLTDTVFAPISQFTTSVKYLRPTGISAIRGKRAAINMTGNNQVLFTESFSNLSITNNTGAFTFSNDVSIVSVSVTNAYVTLGATSVSTVSNVYMYLDANVIVKNNGPDTLKSFYLSNVFYTPGICGINFMHLPEVFALAPQGTVSVPTGIHVNYLGNYFGQTLPTTYTVPPICFYTSIPNKTADNNPDNDYLCVELPAPVPVVESITELGAGNLGLSLVPNPAHEKLQIKCSEEEFSYTIIDALGRYCLSGSVSNSVELDCSALAKGIYIVNVNAKGYSQQKKLVIQ